MNPNTPQPSASRRLTLLRAAFSILHFSFLLATTTTAAAAADPDAPWRNPSLPIETRVNALVSRLTLVEKISQLSADPLAIPRLGIPAYSHRNECLHGLREGEGFVTVFPQATAMAATWDAPLIKQEADAIATEARARYNDYAAAHDGNASWRHGLTYYSPTLNILRDPRWGRGQETYGEDPFLTGRIGIAFITGLQGDDPRYIKILACAKHFAVHSGPEKTRHFSFVNPPERDLYETYLPAFEAAVREAKVGSVMAAHTGLYGVPCVASDLLLGDILRGQWAFTGFVVSDGNGIRDVWDARHYRPTPEEGAAAALKAGTDIASGNVPATQVNMDPHAGYRQEGKGWATGGQGYNILLVSREKNLVTDAQIDRAVRNELTSRFRVGLFDPPENLPWSHLTKTNAIDTPAHRALALRVAEKSIVLLKNDGILPLDRARYKRIAVIGPNAGASEMLLGNYHGTPSSTVTILQGIQQLASPAATITHARGCPAAVKTDKSNAPTPADTAAALDAAKSADLVIFVSGIDAELEREQADGKGYDFPGFDKGDRTRIELPEQQETLIKQLHALGKPMVLVNCSGGAMAMPWEAQNIPAIVQAWYPGQSGGAAVARVLFGEVNPAGRLPMTFYASTADLPPFDDYSMAGRTYKYFPGKPLYAFGHGLSYTTFAYENATLAGEATGTLKLTFTLKNTGARDGEEVPQVYFRHLAFAQPQAKLALCGFTRVAVGKGARKQVTIEIPVDRLRYYDTTAKRYTVEPGDYELLLGAASDDIRATLPLKIQ